MEFPPLSDPLFGTDVTIHPEGAKYIVYSKPSEKVSTRKMLHKISTGHSEIIITKEAEPLLGVL